MGHSVEGVRVACLLNIMQKAQATQLCAGGTDMEQMDLCKQGKVVEPDLRVIRGVEFIIPSPVLVTGNIMNYHPSAGGWNKPASCLLVRQHERPSQMT